MEALKRYNEEELVLLLRQHDASAFSYLYDNYSGALHGVILGVLPHAETALDILQDVFVKIWKQISVYDESKGRLFTWMLTIARNAAIDAIRSKDWKNQQRNSELTSNSIVAAGASQVNTDTIGIRKIVHGLKEEYKVLVELSYFEGHTQEDISKILGIPIGTVKTRLRKALSELRTQIKL